METALIGIVGGLLSLGIQWAQNYLSGAPQRKKVADGLAKRSVDELHAGGDGVRDNPTAMP